jgi:DNA-binding NarL/FixJ family response regulator
MRGLIRDQFRLLPGTCRYTELHKRTARKYGAMVKSGNKKIVKPGAPIKIVLASGSKIFLEGFRKILEGESGIKIVAEASSYEEAGTHLTEVEFKVLFIDNRALNLDAGELSNLINMKGSDTKAILFENQARDKINLPGVIYITKETTSLELIYIVKSAGAASS